MLQRDRPETPFSKLLEAFLRGHARVRAAVFIDEVGECIDYASQLTPYDAQVLGAQLAGTTGTILQAFRQPDAGALTSWSCATDSHVLFVHRVTEQHCLVLLVAPPPLTAEVLRDLPALALALRLEGELEPAPWELLGEPVDVETRSSPQWDHAPRAYIDGRGERHEVEVLGGFYELSRGALPRDALCYRVRVRGSELTLVYSAREDRWYRR